MLETQFQPRESVEMADAALQRKNMVESQVRPSDVTDRRITSAMQALAREQFVPEASRDLAYMDEAIAVAPGRAMLAPRTLAKLVQLADIKVGDRVLDVGCLTGYAALLLGKLAKDVVALECDATLAAKARENLAAAAVKNVTVETGALTAGQAAKGPYDAIVLEGACSEIPAALLDQLSQGGRLVAIEAGEDGFGEAVVIVKSALSLARRPAFDAAGPLLPGMGRPKSFDF